MNAKIKIDTSSQTLNLFQQNENSSSPNQLIKTFPISTSIKGSGQIEGSFKTPIGRHRVYQKIGEKSPIGSIFKARKPTGEIYHFNSNDLNHPNQNLILTRIIWLIGEERGFNLGIGEGRLQGKNVDTKERYIYIHGTNHEQKIGTAISKGCILMKTDDLIDLFDQIDIGDQVCIQ